MRTMSEGSARIKDCPFYLTEADVPGYAASCGMSSEEAGREIRYRALREALEREGAGVRGRIAVAHNGNDRAETMLFHLFRGTGLTGMSGIRPVSGNIIRPLLCVEREEIENGLGNGTLITAGTVPTIRIFIPGTGSDTTFFLLPGIRSVRERLPI